MDENLNINTFPENGEEKKEKGALREMLEWIVCIAVAFLVAFVLKTYVMTIAVVDGNSMQHTLHDKERLITWKLGYEPKKNDIVIFEPPASTPERRIYYVKRVIATEHQDVVIDYNESAVYVDGEKIDEPYIKDQVMSTIGQRAITSDPESENNVIVDNVIRAVVPEDHVYVLGDNRNNSQDSRTIGFVPEEDIEGKVIFRFWPLNTIGIVK